MPPITHSRISPSGLERVLNCPGSVKLSAGICTPPSVYAVEGQAAHYVAEQCLTKKKEARSFVGKKVNVGYGSNVQRHLVDEEMAGHVQNYVDAVLASLGRSNHRIGVFESTFDLSWISDGMQGTADALIIEPLSKLEVWDLKYGAGVIVDVEDNPQLMTYGLGCLGETNQHLVEEVELIVYQPRASTGEVRKSHSYTPDHLYAWLVNVLRPGISRCFEADPALVAGSWCRWCPAYSEKCSLPRKQMFDAVGVSTDAVAVPNEKQSLPDPLALDAGRVSRIAQVLETFEPWVKQFKETMLARMMKGEKFEGFKLVNGRATRKWKSQERAEGALAKHGGDAYDITFKSPAQMEKMLKKKGEELPSDLLEISQSVIVAKADDKRPEIQAIETMFPDDPLGE